MIIKINYLAYYTIYYGQGNVVVAVVVAVVVLLRG